MTEKITSILLTGPPGIGKTTVVQKLVRIFQKNHLKCVGFYTEEVRFDNGGRIGFDVVTLDGKRAVLAREFPTDNVNRPKIGKYSVYIKDFEDIALPVLKVAAKTLLIIDEVGKMELLSKKFKQQIGELFGKTAILATIPIARQPIDIVERMKADKSSVVLEITKKNRNEIVSDIFERSCQMIWE